MKENIDLYVYNSKADKKAIEKLISDYIPFIIKVISDEKNVYINIENDEEYSIALIAFGEAIKRYEISRGSFFSFARLVIISRLFNFWKSEKKHQHDTIDESIHNMELKQDQDLIDEIELYKRELLKFGLDFELLIYHSPKHKDTRTRAITLAKEISKNEAVIKSLYDKKRLPLTQISKAYNLSLKVLKKSKIFIIGLVIVFHKDFKLINEWIDKKGPQN